MSKLYACVECGHLHYEGKGVWAECLICDCRGQDDKGQRAPVNLATGPVDEQKMFRLYDLAIRPRDAAREARAWLLDCFGDDGDAEVIRLLNAISLVQAIEQYYEGGYRQFLAHGFNLKPSKATA